MPQILIGGRLTEYDWQGQENVQFDAQDRVEYTVGGGETLAQCADMCRAYGNIFLNSA